jgi:glucose-6-phosphate 1-dehydrogenase
MRFIAGKQLNQKMTGVVVRYHDGRQDVFSETKSNERRSPAYQRVLLAAIAGQKELFTSSEEVLQSWELLRPLQQQWEMDGEQPVRYPKGSSIEAVIQLVGSDNTTTSQS